MAADVLPREIFAFTANATQRNLVPDVSFLFSGELAQNTDTTSVHRLNTRRVAGIWSTLAPLAI
jgi:hypothetical protein